MATPQPHLTLLTQENLDRELSAMRGDIGDIKGSLSKVADALTKLAVLEERHQTVQSTTNKILSRMERMEERQQMVDKREYAMEEMGARLKKSEDTLIVMQRDKHIQEGKVSATLLGVRMLWALLASSGVIAAIVGYFF